MRAVAVAGTLVFAVAAGLIGWVVFTGGECAVATVHRSVEACISAGLPRERCATLLAEADLQLLQSGPVFDMREQCEERYVSCQRAAGATGFVPRAKGFCLKAGPPERLVPVFGR